jgi:hypothetical protein
MVKNLKSVLYLLMLLSGGVLAVQCILLLSVAAPVKITGIGTVPKATISAFLIEISLVCAVLIALALLSFLSGHGPNPTKKLSSLFILLIAGSVCCVEGVASINLSSSIANGINGSFMIPFGVQLFCLGIISISSFVAAKGSSYLFKNIPNYYALIFFILLIPAAFLIND